MRITGDGGRANTLHSGNMRAAATGAAVAGPNGRLITFSSEEAATCGLFRFRLQVQSGAEIRIILPLGTIPQACVAAPAGNTSAGATSSVMIENFVN